MGAVVRWVILLGLLLSLPAITYAQPVEWPVAEGGNGHWYELVLTPTPSWAQAKLAAETFRYSNRMGHLATLNSPEEDAFVKSAFVFPDAVWLGALHDPQEPDPAVGWHWIVNEHWVYTGWCTGEPDNDPEDPLGSEEVFLTLQSGLCWDDIGDWPSGGPGFLVEYDEYGAIPTGSGSWGTLKASY